MQVIFVIVSMAGGGAERVISILANQFVRQDIGVTIMMTAGNEVAYQLDKRVQLVSVGGTSGGSMVRRVKRLARMRRIFKQQKAAVIISFGPGTSFFAVTAALFLKNRFIISERNDPAICPYPRLRNLIYSRASRLVFQTGMAAMCFPEILQKRGCVIGNPLDENLPSIEIEKVDRRLEIVAVGRLDPQKNYALLLEAFSIFIRKIRVAYQLTIYGKGNQLHDLRKQADSLGISDQVIFAGFENDVLEKIKDSAMYVLSSDYEGIPNSLLEAMAVGLPVIATDCPIGGAAALIQDGENGILVPVGDAKAIANAMFMIAQNPQKAKEMGEAALKVCERYSVNVIAKLWLDEIRKVIK